MGYTLRISNRGQVVPRELLQASEALVKEVALLEAVWESSLERSVIQQMIARMAKDLGFAAVGDPSRRKNFSPTPPYYSEIQNKASVSVAFEFVPAQGGKLTLTVEPDRHGIASQICPSCGGTTVNGKPAVAHSIIPQEIWKNIVENAIKEFIVVVRTGILTQLSGNRTYKVRSFHSGSGIRSGSGNAKSDSGKLEEKEEKSLDFTDLDKESQLFVKKLTDNGLLMSSYAAQDNSQRQCLRCESMQGSYSLLQRLKLEASGKLAPSFQYNHGTHLIEKNHFVGSKFLDDAQQIRNLEQERGVTPLSKEEAFKRKTTAQLGRFLIGIEKCIDDQVSKNVSSPLLLMLIDHWEEFVWVFRTQGLKLAGNYDLL